MSVVETPFRYAEETDAEDFVAWCSEFLIQSEDQWAGRPLNLEGWQQNVFDEILAIDPVTEGNYWRSAVLVLPRKNGKTQMLAALALYRLLTDEGQPEILLAAATDKQAGRLFDKVVSFLRRNRALDQLVHRRESIGEIVNIETGGKIIRLPSSGETLDGYNPSLAICDELHAWTTPTRRRVWTSLTTGGAARLRTQVVTITTAGDAFARSTSILGRLIDANEQRGECTVDGALTVSRNHEARTIAWNWSALTTDPSDAAAMKAANPASWVSEDFLARQAANPELTDAEVLQLHGCVWAEGFDAWVTAEAWQACHVHERIPAGAEVIVGVDIGIVHDASAVAIAWEAPDGRIHVDTRVWGPHGAAADVTTSGRLDLREIEAYIALLAREYRVREVAYDPRFFERSAQELSEQGNVVVALEQSSARMADAYQDWYQGVTEATVAHNGNPTLTAHVMGTAAEKTERGWKVRKMRQSGRIDAHIAAVMAHYRCRAVQEEVEPPIMVALV